MTSVLPAVTSVQLWTFQAKTAADLIHPDTRAVRDPRYHHVIYRGIGEDPRGHDCFSSVDEDFHTGPVGPDLDLTEGFDRAVTIFFLTGDPVSSCKPDTVPFRRPDQGSLSAVEGDGDITSGSRNGGSQTICTV